MNRSLTDCLKVDSDVVAAPVLWGGAAGELSDLIGRSVRLRCELTSAELFSYWFE
eukprot:COSAG03_NODE_4899_length_1401_cov_14.565284_1_plen_55_part_00